MLNYLLKTCFTKLLLTKSFDLLFKKKIPSFQIQIVNLCMLNLLLQGQSIFNYERKRFTRNVFMFCENYSYCSFYVCIIFIKVISKWVTLWF